jgi:hypothetical protein
MNLESCQRARSVGYRGACNKDPDRLMVYDGRSKKSKLLASVSGDITDAVNKHDSWTSSGRDMYVEFITDGGNWGLSKTKEDPGFYAEWQIIKNGQACEKFKAVPGTALSGHNNELIVGNVKTCEAACCQRAWCKSFDYNAKRKCCNLADLDATKQFGETVKSSVWTLYEKPEAVIKATPKKLGKSGCSGLLSRISSRVNGVCCGRNGKMCLHGAPRTCSEECAQQWTPFAEVCSEWVKDSIPSMNKVTGLCERTEYGRYRAGRRKGRCNDDDLIEFGKQFKPACCGYKAKHCRAGVAVGFDKKSGVLMLPRPTDSRHRLMCSDGCATVVDKFYEECHTRLEQEDKKQHTHTARDAEKMLRLCQGMGAHRRMLLTEIETGTDDVNATLQAKDGEYGEFSEYFEASDDTMLGGL